MANERVSQLNQLLESEIQANDVFLVTDTSQKESKKLQIVDVVTYVQTNGTFNAVHSSVADTASYIKASNIDGLEIANVVNVATTWISFDMEGFESDALGSVDCSSGALDESVFDRQFVLQLDLSSVPQNTDHSKSFVLVVNGDILCQRTVLSDQLKPSNT